MTVQTISASTGLPVEVPLGVVTVAVAVSPPALSSSSVVPWMPVSGSLIVAVPPVAAGPDQTNVLPTPVDRMPAGFVR